MLSFFTPSSPSADGAPDAGERKTAALLKAWAVPCLAVLALLALHYGWWHRYAQELEQRGQRERHAELARAAGAVAAAVPIWLTAGEAAGWVEVEAVPPHRVLHSEGLPIPRELWFFPDSERGERGESWEPGTLAPPARLPGVPSSATRGATGGAAPDAASGAAPSAASGAAPDADREMLLVARTRGGVTTIRALPVSALREILAAHQGPCLRGAVQLPTHAGAVLLYTAPPSAALRQVLTAGAGASPQVGAEETLAVASSPLAGAGLPLAESGGGSLRAGFESLCPAPAQEQLFATFPVQFWVGQGLVTVAVLLGVCMWCRARAGTAGTAASAFAADKAATSATELAHQLRAERAQRRQLGGQLITLLEGVRSSIARELHDHTGQRLTAVLLDLESAPPSPSLLEKTACELRGIHEELRGIARGLRPPALDVLGLEAALRALCGECGVQNAGQGLEVHFFADKVPLLFGDKGLALYRVAQEALHNAARHAAATQVFVSLTGRGEVLALTVEDNGRGFASAHAGEAAPARTGGLGLLLMTERMAQWGGTLHVESTPGRGTVVMADLPID